MDFNIFFKKFSYNKKMSGILWFDCFLYKERVLVLNILSLPDQTRVDRAPINWTCSLSIQSEKQHYQLNTKTRNLSTAFMWTFCFIQELYKKKNQFCPTIIYNITTSCSWPVFIHSIMNSTTRMYPSTAVICEVSDCSIAFIWIAT